MIFKLIIIILLIIIVQQHEIDLWSGITGTFEKIRQLQTEINSLFSQENITSV